MRDLRKGCYLRNQGIPLTQTFQQNVEAECEACKGHGRRYAAPCLCLYQVPPFRQGDPRGLISSGSTRQHKSSVYTELFSFAAKFPLIPFTYPQISSVTYFLSRSRISVSSITSSDCFTGSGSFGVSFFLRNRFINLTRRNTTAAISTKSTDF